MVQIAKTKLGELLEIPRLVKDSDLLKTCYLCNSAPEDDIIREHIIPRTLFRPDNLEDPPILPACKGCNQQKSACEEHVSRFVRLLTDKPAAERPSQRLFENAGLANRSVIAPVLDSWHYRSLRKMYPKIKTGVFPSESGVLTNRAYVQIDEEDIKRFGEFYVYLTKGLITLTTGRIHDWSKYEVKVSTSFEWQNDEVADSVKNIVAEFVFCDSWGSQSSLGDCLMLAGINLESTDGKPPIYVWGARIYDNWEGVSFLSTIKSDGEA